MNIILFCVFGINPLSAGNLEQFQLSVNRAYYEVLKYEDDGNKQKLRLCRKHFHKKADLAWMHDA